MQCWTVSTTSHSRTTPTKVTARSRRSSSSCTAPKTATCLQRDRATLRVSQRDRATQPYRIKDRYEPSEGPRDATCVTEGPRDAAYRTKDRYEPSAECEALVNAKYQSVESEFSKCRLLLIMHPPYSTGALRNAAIHPSVCLSHSARSKTVHFRTIYCYIMQKNAARNLVRSADIIATVASLQHCLA